MKWISLVLIIAAVGAGGYFGYKYYQNYQENKIYSVNETVNFTDFDFRVTKSEYKAVNLPIDNDTVKKYGGIEKKEDCDKLSDSPTYFFDYPAGATIPDVPPKTGPSDRVICERRNESRSAIQEYSSDNKQLVVDFTITARSEVNSGDLKIELEADSGRNLNEKVDTFNVNQFFKYGAQEKRPLMLDGTIPTYGGEYKQVYIPYFASPIKGDINKGLERKGYIYTDIRNSENTVDMKITYKNDTRIVRITR